MNALTPLCKHLLPTQYCSMCNGLETAVLKRMKQEKDDSYEISILREKYEAVKSTFKNHDEPWTEEDSETLYDKLNGISNTHSKAFRKAVYEVAMMLGRTRGSIVWHYKHMFIDFGQKKRNEWKFRAAVEGEVLVGV